MRELWQILILIQLGNNMENTPFIVQERHHINNKTFLVPKFQLQGFEKYFLPKLESASLEHVFFSPKDINQLYKEQNLDPEELDCNLKYQLEPSHVLALQPRKSSIISQKNDLKRKESEHPIQQSKMQIPKITLKKRPILRQNGFTHFIHIPFVQPCKDIFESQIKTQIDANDHDALVSVDSLHATIMVFRLRKIEDLAKWEQILNALKLKKVKAVIRGVGIFPTKPNTNYTNVLYLKVDGLDEIIHEIVSKAVDLGLVVEKQLSHIAFDKKTDTYKADQQHLTLLKTKGKDLIDATAYLKAFSKINVGKVPVTEIRLSMIGTFEEGKGYFDECVIAADK